MFRKLVERIVCSDLAQNKLHAIENNTFCDFKKLEVLSLDRNNLTTIYPETICAPNLRELHLDYNNIQLIASTSFQPLTAIKLINLDYNPILNLPPELFKSTVKTTILRLPFNNISKIDATAFKDLDKVAILRLQTNNIKHVDRKAFFGLNKLKLLQLSGNPIGNFREFNLPNTASMNFLGLSRSYPLKLDENRNRASNPVIIETLDLTNNFLSTIKNLDFGDCRTL
ncbi:uncharacterized protein TRIADDRAFT_60110 [Trichoplax adhaerens]|uniref:LRRNT domain-containing protein n=1 Tax=Trichoplax adhaerens TaxID=10228 RepID=B3S7B9_TRIAD|nr:hypothetical protein TRIADDRAFT_60110 [Trichoplax adhaerens]EDV21540.1 hypothetical protein TRIADDRAFT_60110 [Trichoplax adhaerens]|eukprot:XP_002116140.1 hypothetical protein TRIADDRAFT_60110 [Trichoplax adhaerens]